MILKYIIEICVAIDIAILGIAYPIVIDKISNIGDKYESNYLSEVFRYEFPHNLFKVSWLRINWSLFKTLLILTILSFIPLIFNLKPLFGWDNWFINNSAELLVLVMTFILTLLFFVWIDKVSLFNGKSTQLLTHLIKEYQSSRKEYYLKTINEFTFYSLRHQDEHLQKTLMEFYHSEFYRTRNSHDKSNPLIYKQDLYQLVYQINFELVHNENIRLRGIEHRAVSGVWLLGGDMAQISISTDTYTWLWRIIYLINSKPKYIKMFWANSHQYFRFDLDLIRENFDYQLGEVTNGEEIKKRNNERDEFLEFHHAVGGLLLYKEQYQSLRYTLNFSQSSPPDYVLLPRNMSEIFSAFENFRNEYRPRPIPIDNKYFFPDLDNLGNSHEVVYWICSYVTLLFVRQFSLTRSFRNQNFVSQPVLPDDVNELNNWNDGLTFFKKCLNDICENEQLLSSLGFDELVRERKTEFFDFIDQLEGSITNKIGIQQRNAEISSTKKLQFVNKTKDIISNAYSEYGVIFQEPEKIQNEPDNLELSLNGSKTLFQKSAFSDQGITHLNFDSVFAESLSRHVIKNFIPNSFLVARTRRYLVSKEKLNSALKKLGINNEQYSIVVFNPHFDLLEHIKDFNPIVKSLPAVEFRNTLFVLKNNDLPAILFNEKEDYADEKLECIDDEHKVYASVLDLNKPENEANKQLWPNEDDIETKVEATIAFNSTLLWKKEREVVQINIESQYEEQGVVTLIDDIVPFKIEPIEK